MWILITGVNGFVGKQLAYFLLSKGYKVIGLNRSKKSVRSLNFFKTNYIDFNEPIENISLLKEKVSKVIHLASKTTSIDSLNNHLYENLNITKKVLDFCIKNSIKQIIFLSSISVYGDITSNYIKEDTKIYNPNPYGMTKYLSEMMLSDLSKNTFVICIRVPAIIGKEASKNLLVNWVDQASKNVQIELKNPDAYSNSLIHVEDIINLINELLFVKKEKGSLVLNLACQKSEKLIDIVKMITAHFNSKLKISKTKYKKPPIISTKKIKAELKYEPLTVKEAIAKYLKEL